VKVEFHVGLEDPLQHALRLLRKAVRHGERRLVASPRAEALSRLIWSFDPHEFLPHARPGAAVAVWARSPLWLLPDWTLPPEAGTPPSVWLGLDAELAPEAGPARLIELVSREPEAAEAARHRWRLYKARGWQPDKVFDGAG
jgi:DNA polymerase III subunit chi